MNQRYPRVLLVSLGGPNARYKVIPRIACRLPSERMFWASFWGHDDSTFAGTHRAFPPSASHWRLRSHAVGYIYEHVCQAARIARRIVTAFRAAAPEVVWVVPEVGAARVGALVARALNVPLHLTLHDAHETARDQLPRGYYPFYARAFRAAVRQAASLDAISEPLLEHELQCRAKGATPAAMVFYPAMPDAWRIQSVAERDFAAGALRRVGLCGSMRVDADQWAQFVDILGQLPFRIELVAVAYPDMFHRATLPKNVELREMPFVESETELIALFERERVHACYLGLWRDPRHGLFARTSLSAKLTTYVAAGVPVIADVPADSEAWRVVGAYGAGVLLGRERQADRHALTELLGNPALWRERARGAQALCRAKLCLEPYMAEFGELLARTAGLASR